MEFEGRDSMALSKGRECWQVSLQLSTEIYISIKSYEIFLTIWMAINFLRVREMQYILLWWTPGNDHGNPPFETYR